MRGREDFNKKLSYYIVLKFDFLETERSSWWLPNSSSLEHWGQAVFSTANVQRWFCVWAQPGSHDLDTYCYIVTWSLFDWAHTQNDPWICHHVTSSALIKQPSGHPFCFSVTIMFLFCPEQSGIPSDGAFLYINNPVCQARNLRKVAAPSLTNSTCQDHDSLFCITGPLYSKTICYHR